MLKVGLIGVGGISGAHIPAWDGMEDAELTALCDIRPGQMEKYPSKHHYERFDDMLEQEPLDILDICLPTYLHTAYAEKAMRRGIHVLCEKPVSLHAVDIPRLTETAAKQGVKFMVAQVLRFWPEYEQIKELYESRRYGRLVAGSMSRLGGYPSQSWDGWMMDEKRSGLVPFDLHIHDLDFLVYAFGTPKNATRFRAKEKTQDYVNAVYEFDGFFVTADASWYASPVPFRMGFRFQFEEAVAVYEDNRLTIYERSGRVFSPQEEKAGDSGILQLPETDAYANEIRYFADAVQNDTPIDRVTPESLTTVLRLLKSL